VVKYPGEVLEFRCHRVATQCFVCIFH